MGPLVIHISHAYNVCSWPPKRFLEVSPADEVLSDMVWMSELGLPMLRKLYELEGSTMDVFNDEGGIGRRLKWKRSEEEIFLYDSELTGGPLMPVCGRTA